MGDGEQACCDTQTLKALAERQTLTGVDAMQNNTMHLWYSKSHAACSWVGASGMTFAPGGDLLFSTSRNTAQTWNTTVSHRPCHPGCCVLQDAF